MSDLLPLLQSRIPFVHPAPLWNVWYWLLLPLCAAISIVYKSVKCRHMRQVPREAAIIFFWILAGMAAAAAALAILVRLLER